MYRTINATMDCVCALFTAMIFLYLRMSADKKDKLNRLLAWICVFNMGMLLGDLPNWLCEGFAKPWYPAALRIGCFVQFVSGCMAPWVYSQYLHTYLSRKTQMKKWLLPTIHTLFVFSAALLLLNFFNGMYYYIDEFNTYQRGGWHWLSQTIPVMILLFDAVIVVQYRRVLRLQDAAAFLSYLILPIIGISIQARFYGTVFTYLTCSMSIFIIFFCIQSEQRLVSEQQKRDLDKAQVMVMLSQIKPHFLYNSLLGIKQLCDTEPNKASDALEHFAYYLRGNLYSVSEDGLVPFRKELEHLQDYLYLEKMRFEERLNVRLEIGYTDFMLPSLTLQPIAENAVRHGITKKDGGGTLTIRSELVRGEVRLTVLDDGVGFDTGAALDNSRPHIGLNNVRRRMESQCGGRVEIKSSPGRGTQVNITLPCKGIAVLAGEMHQTGN